MEKPKYFEQHEELKYLSAHSELRDMIDKIDKAVYIMRHYAGEVKFTLRGICDYYDLNRDTLQARVWSTLLGYTEHTVKKPRYLALIHEARLADILDQNQKQNNSTSKDELLLLVK